MSVARIAEGRAFALAAVLAGLLASPVQAFEWLDGRVQVHGFYEMQLRTISANYRDSWDVTQWYNILNLELELDILQDSIGPIDIVSAYVRAEARYDCIYSHGCGTFRSIDAFGNDSQNAQLPHRLANAKSNTWSGNIPVSIDDGLFSRERLIHNEDGSTFELAPNRRRMPVDLFQVGGFDTLSTQPGADNRVGTPLPGFMFDDPFPYVFERFDDYYFTQTNGRGGSDNGNPVQRLGPWLPRNTVQPNATLADRVNPFDDTRQSPVLFAAVFNTELAATGNEAAALAAAQAARGSGSRPFQAIPVVPEGGFAVNDPTPRGLFSPSPGLQRALESGDLDYFGLLNLSEAERAWNRGASQQQTKELKEAYLDIEMFDSRLWMRIGKQNIVWGKTELFRTTDQFNPQDVALASLPSLEESRIPLWAFRAIYSFYEVGPFEDVRFEFAFNFDEFQTLDLGACGEPYTVDLVCQAAFGVWAHGTTGIGLAGIDFPEDPWQDLSGWEIGGRIEWRWDRFSFAISDFWGYPDVPYPDAIQYYERNVDPTTGRPRIAGARGPCTDGNQVDCLRPGPEHAIASPEFTLPKTAPDGFGGLSDEDRLKDSRNALENHHANQTVFTMVCSTTIGVLSLDRTACAQNAFGSQVPQTFFTVAQLIGSALAGSTTASQFFSQAPVFNPETGMDEPIGIQLPLVTLHPGVTDPTDNGGTDCMDDRFQGLGGPDPPPAPCGSGGAGGVLPVVNQTLGQHLTAAQEALVGCGPFWGVQCDDSGISLMNAEGSVLVQSFAGASTNQADIENFTTDNSRGFFHQPGTRFFDGQAAVCTFGNLLVDRDEATKRDANGNRLSARKLPGCRSPYDAPFADDMWNYDPLTDGVPSGVVSTNPFDCLSCIGPVNGHPFTGQQFHNELAALSWNFQILTIFQDSDFVENVLPDRTRAYQAGGCSFVTPQYCSNVQGLLRLMGLQRNVVQAGGNAGFGRRDFQWHSGGELVLEFERRNVLGFSMDFAEDATQANFSMEFTWINNVPTSNADDWHDGITRVDEFNLTISADRPTFINFLNANRTFFFNTQWFFQYINGYQNGFGGNGPWNILGTLAVTTGYYQDRLLPSLVFVYDVQSVSGAAIPQVTYRYNEAFSITVGAAMFMGRAQLTDIPINGIGTAAQQNGPHAFKNEALNGLSAIRDRDEVFLRLRYTF